MGAQPRADGPRSPRQRCVCLGDPGDSGASLPPGLGSISRSFSVPVPLGNTRPLPRGYFWSQVRTRWLWWRRKEAGTREGERAGRRRAGSTSPPLAAGTGPLPAGARGHRQDLLAGPDIRMSHPTAASSPAGAARGDARGYLRCLGPSPRWMGTVPGDVPRQR